MHQTLHWIVIHSSVLSCVPFKHKLSVSKTTYLLSLFNSTKVPFLKWSTLIWCREALLGGSLCPLPHLRAVLPVRIYPNMASVVCKLLGYLFSQLFLLLLLLNKTKEVFNCVLWCCDQTQQEFENTCTCGSCFRDFSSVLRLLILYLP